MRPASGSVAALGNGTLEVLDVGAGTRITSVGGLKEPQGVAYLARQHRVVVAMRGGSVASFDDSSWQRTATIPSMGDSDNLMHVPVAAFADNYPMFLDESGHRLFVGMRRPAALVVFDTTNGNRIAHVPCVGDTDDLFYDARRDRVYVIGGEGSVDVFDAAASGKLDRLAHIPTRIGARTGLWSSDLDRLFVAWPARDGKDAEIHAYAPR